MDAPRRRRCSARLGHCPGCRFLSGAGQTIGGVNQHRLKRWWEGRYPRTLVVLPDCPARRIACRRGHERVVVKAVKVTRVWHIAAQLRFQLPFGRFWIMTMLPAACVLSFDSATVRLRVSPFENMFVGALRLFPALMFIVVELKD